MAEDNTRIVFDDTSNTGSFANNDRMLRANESSDGGANLFSIVDCGTSGTSCEGQGGQMTIMAGAPENSLFVDLDGLIGLGTSVPEKQLHVRDGDTPPCVGDDGTALANTNSDGKAFKTAVRVQDDSGFTITLGGNSTNLHFVAWLAYPLN